MGQVNTITKDIKMAKKNLWNQSRRLNSDETEAAIESFLAKGGEITSLKDDDGSYDKGLKKIENRLDGGFNPFSKTDALKE